MENKELSVFEVLNNINVNEHIEHKNGLSYLSWAWAWATVKKVYPNATYCIYERDMIIDDRGNVCPVNYFTDGKTAWVKTGVKINDIEYIEELYVMDYKNNSVLLNQIDSKIINKTIQRSLTKALARHGLGLYIYAGEDLPEEEKKQQTESDPVDVKLKKPVDEKAEREKYSDYILKHMPQLNEVYKKLGKEFEVDLRNDDITKLKRIYSYCIKNNI